jgi:PAS domain S-box-containing protein
MLDFLTHLFDTAGFPPRWNCGPWTEGHGWLHILSDLGIWSAYLTIPCVLGYFILRRKDIPFRTIFVLFGAFILACGTTHLMEATIFWWPAYRLAGVIKLFTALVSWGTVLALMPAVPKVLAMRSPEELKREIAARRQAEEELHRVNAELERRVEERTTELTQAVAAIRDEREWFRTTLASIGDAVITTDTEGKVTFLNPVAEELTGWTMEGGACGLPLPAVFKMVHEETREPVDSSVTRALREGRIAGLVNHIVLIARDGRERPIEDSAAPIRHKNGTIAGVVLVFRDTTERWRAEQAVDRLRHESEQQRRIYETALSNTADFNYVFDLRGRFVFVNKALLALWNKEFHEAVGKNFFELDYPPDLAEQLQKQIQAVIETRQPVKDETPYTSAAGERQYEYIFVPVLGAGGKVEAVAGSTRDITERKRAEEALREVEARFTAILNYSPFYIFAKDRQGHYLLANKALGEFIGRAAADLLGRTDADIFPAEVAARFARDDSDILASGIPRIYEESFPHGKTIVTTLMVKFPLVTTDGVPYAVCAIATDISDRKRAQEASRYLAEASASLASVVDYESTLQKVANLAVPYFADWSAVDVANDDGTLRRLAVAHNDPDKIRFVHELMREYPPDPHAPSGSLAVFRTGKPEIFHEITDELLAQAAKDERHLTLIRSLGLKSYICVPLVVSGKPLGVLTFATAESGRKYSDTDLALALDLANRAAVAIENTQLYQALREADRRKDEFLATLAHELRNPLAPIRNSLQILKMSRLDAATVERSREMMERQVHHLVRLVDDLLDVSRVMRGKIELRKERVDLATVVARGVETVQPLIDAQRHELIVNLMPGSLPLDADPVRLAQVVGNLLTNAAKYTEANGRIWLTAQKDKNEAVLRVRDTGIGIAPDMLPHIFELFMQVDHAATRSQGGLGIGLTLVKSLVEMHRGSIEAHSEGLGRGSEFVVRLPLVNEERQETDENEKRELPQIPARSSGHRLMVVDDNRDAADSLALLLRLQGHEVRVANDGAAALEMVKVYQPEIVFLDIGMPGMDGYEVARRLRRTPGLENTILAALTGWGQQDDRRRTAEAGFDHHLVKPPESKAVDSLLALLPKHPESK